MNARLAPGPVFNPEIQTADEVTAWWLRQVSLRLRREIAWCWFQRGEVSTPESGRLPPMVDPVMESLDLSRHQVQKERFFHDDVTARYLSEQIAQKIPAAAGNSRFARAAAALGLTDAAQFLTALALAARSDAALGPVCAACQNDAARPYPTLALAQRLWDDPLAIVEAASPQHALFTCGLLAMPSAHGEGLDWQQALEMPTSVASSLLFPDRFLPATLRSLPAGDIAQCAPDNESALRWLVANPARRLQIVPLVGAAGSDFEQAAAIYCQRLGRVAARFAGGVRWDRDVLGPLATAAWLHGVDLLLPEGWVPVSHSQPPGEPWFASMQALPLRCFLPLHEAAHVQALPSHPLAPALTIAPLTHAERAGILATAFAESGPELDAVVSEAARRFRLQKKPLEQVVAALSSFPSVTAEQLFSACRSQVAVQMGALAQRVEPRFQLHEIVLPSAQTVQLEEIVRGMRALSRVHYEWGAARAWNESGLSVLLCGAPGTGKTMAAEAMSNALSLSMYRVDLSQVVNKYIGETEKNLKQIFDAAEASDVVLFFDEADALFGKRTEVTSSHDRFANIEISYLLERMERFKGLAILATNRRKDLDEAFTRRLRYLIEFPMPSPVERERIWRLVFPPGADVSALDFNYLADQFELSGGHIRSIAFNACLQSAADESPRRAGGGVDMRTVLIATRRELEKMGRPIGPGIFGRYAHVLGAAL